MKNWLKWQICQRLSQMANSLFSVDKWKNKKNLLCITIEIGKIREKIRKKEKLLAYYYEVINYSEKNNTAEKQKSNKVQIK